MKNIATFIFLLVLPLVVSSQNYNFHSTRPFGTEPIVYPDSTQVAFKYMFSDEDQDGDLDLIMMGIDEILNESASTQFNLTYFIAYQENIGSKTEPLFATRSDRFSTFEMPSRGNFILPAGGDLNGDGRIDFVLSSEVDIYNEQYLMFYIQNEDGSFEVSNCLDWELPTFTPFSFFIPELVDLDMDGDLDILLGGYYGKIRTSEFDEEEAEIEQINTFIYAKNIGTKHNPDFVGWYINPYGLSSTGQSFFASGDMDLDGDMDLINLSLDEGQSVLALVENKGGLNQRPIFETPEPGGFNLPVAGEDDGFIFPTLVDIDGDGDLDLFLPVSKDGSFDLDYYENDLCSGHANIMVTVSSSTIFADENASYTYRWQDCETGQYLEGFNDYFLEAPYSGSFAVEVTQANGCIGYSDCISVVVSDVDETYVKPITIYPTVTQGQLYIESDLRIDQLRIFNATGRMVLQRKLLNASTLDVSDLEEGIYFIEMEVDGKTQTQKFIKIKG